MERINAGSCQMFAIWVFGKPRCVTALGIYIARLHPVDYPSYILFGILQFHTSTIVTLTSDRGQLEHHADLIVYAFKKLSIHILALAHPSKPEIRVGCSTLSLCPKYHLGSEVCRRGHSGIWGWPVSSRSIAYAAPTRILLMGM